MEEGLEMEGFSQISSLKVIIILINVFIIGGLSKIIVLLKPVLCLEENTELRKEIRQWFISIEIVIGAVCIISFIML